MCRPNAVSENAIQSLPSGYSCLVGRKCRLVKIKQCVTLTKRCFILAKSRNILLKRRFRKIKQPFRMTKRKKLPIFRIFAVVK
ncbi:MAG: hypothetical protein LBL74_06130 [Bacteroidales bacterium]|jgi:hypothetical protein|nr:hypothetical protein [Bacteroidales bacterium]